MPFSISKPTLLIDESRCKANIRRMAEKVKRHGCVFQPHFKTHQSATIGEWFKEEGVQQIKVSSLDMATYFADNGWADITVAFPVNARQIKAINELASRIRLTLFVSSVAALRLLVDGLKHPVHYFIEVDAGYHRTGLAPEKDANVISELIDLSRETRATFAGFYCHAGNTYQARNNAAVQAIHNEALRVLNQLKESYKTDHPDLQLAYGDTPSASMMDNFAGVDLLGPGNFAFYDLTQAQIGSCTVDNIATAVACPVVEKYPERNQIIVHGGAVHFSKDQLIEGDTKIYGKVAAPAGDGWGELIPDVVLGAISQEHGIIVAPKDFVNATAVGDLLFVLPVHSCLAADLFPVYHTLDGREISKFNKL